MIASGELFLLNGETGGELQPLPTFLNSNIRVIAGSFRRVYVACEPPVPPANPPKQPCKVYRLEGDNPEPVLCREFDAIDGAIRQVASGEKHLLVLTHDGTVFSKGSPAYGNTGHGGARDVPEFQPLPSLRGHKVKFIAAGPHYSIALTHDGDVFSWGRGFSGETGVFGQVETVPRFAPIVTKCKVLTVSCGDSHVLACTEMQQCISWGENMCGQLGIGCKTQPTYKPQLLDAIPSQIRVASAGWAHSIAVGSDGRVYSWGLNSHGQLGLGDTVMRLAPHLVHDLVGTHEIESAHAARTLTIFRTAGCRALLCGQIPCAPNSKLTAEFHPRRPGERDPAGCLLSPVVLTLATDWAVNGKVPETTRPNLSQVVAFDRGAVGFAQSGVYRIEPNVAPIDGGTTVWAHVNGLPFETLGRRDPSTPLVQDQIPAKVRLKSSSPLVDVIVAGRIVAKDIVEFQTPDIKKSPLGSMVEKGGGTYAVQARVSIDDGFTWTVDRFAAPKVSDLGRSTNSVQLSVSRSASPVQEGLQVMKAESEDAHLVSIAANVASTLLWVCSWPKEGPTHVEPVCVPVTGGTELLLHVQLPSNMPTDFLVVKVNCTPFKSIGDPDLERTAPMRRDADEILNPDQDAIAQLPLAADIEVPVVAWLDPGSRGVRCTSPPLDANCVAFYEYTVQLSLDGHFFFSRALPISVYQLTVTGLEPDTGSLMEATAVRIKAAGLVKSDVHWVRIDFPATLQWPSRQLPARFDHTSEEIYIDMPDLCTEVTKRVEEATEEAKVNIREEPPRATTADSSVGRPDTAAATLAVDPSGGLDGIEVFVELSLNGQNFTEDRVTFTYHRPLEPGAVMLISLPEGHGDLPKEDGKEKKKKGSADEASEEVVVAGAKLGCTAVGAIASSFAALRAELRTKTADEDESQLLRAVDLPGAIEMIQPKAPPASAPDPKDKNPPPAMEAPPPVEMLTALAPSVRAEELPEGATLYLVNFMASLNGQSFANCAIGPPIRLEPLPPLPRTAEEQ